MADGDPFQQELHVGLTQFWWPVSHWRWRVHDLLAKGLQPCQRVALVLAHQPRVAWTTQPREASWGALKADASDWSAHKSAKAGAAIAYYSILSLRPLIVVVISIAALIFGREGVQREVTDAIRGLLGDKGGESVNTMLSAADKPSEGIFASVIGTVTLIFAAVGVVVQLKEALNVVWEVKPKAGGGIWGFARNYVLSLAGVLALGFLLLVSMLLTAGLAAFTSHFSTFIPEPLMQAGAASCRAKVAARLQPPYEFLYLPAVKRVTFSSASFILGNSVCA